MPYRNKKHGQFQDESSIFLGLHGLTSTGMSAGATLGFSRNPKIKTLKKHQISCARIKKVQKMFSHAMKKGIKSKHLISQVINEIRPYLILNSQKKHYFPLIC